MVVKDKKNNFNGKNKRPHVIWGLCLLGLGSIIYFCFRPNIIIFDMFNIRFDSLHHSNNNVVNYLIYCLPDGFWFSALLLIQFGISNNPYNFMFLLCVLSPFILEICQITFLPGTFDWFDIITYLLTLIIFCLCVKRKSPSFKHQCSLHLLFQPWEAVLHSLRQVAVVAILLTLIQRPLNLVPESVLLAVERDILCETGKRKRVFAVDREKPLHFLIKNKNRGC